MQQRKTIEEPGRPQVIHESRFAQRLMGWGVQFVQKPSSNAERFDELPLDLDERVRRFGEW